MTKNVLMLPMVLLLGSCLSGGSLSGCKRGESVTSAPVAKSGSERNPGASVQDASSKEDAQESSKKPSPADIDVQLALWMYHQEQARDVLSYLPHVNNWAVWNQMPFAEILDKQREIIELAEKREDAAEKAQWIKAWYLEQIEAVKTLRVVVGKEGDASSGALETFSAEHLLDIQREYLDQARKLEGKPGGKE